MYIYIVENQQTGQQYVGRTERKLARRRLDALAHARRGDVGVLFDAIRKHGEEAFTYSKLRTCPKAHAGFWENYYIYLFDTLQPRGYNVSGGMSSLPSDKITELLRLYTRMEAR